MLRYSPPEARIVPASGVPPTRLDPRQTLKAARRIGVPGVESEEVIVAARVHLPDSDSGKQIGASFIVQYANAAEFEICVGIHDIARQSPSRCAIAADIEIARSLLRSRVLN